MPDRVFSAILGAFSALCMGASAWSGEGLEIDSPGYPGMERLPELPGFAEPDGGSGIGPELDFFLISGGGSNLSADESLNSDGVADAAAFAEPGSPYLFMRRGSRSTTETDRSFNDLLISIYAGENEYARLAETGGERLIAPEPALALGGLLAAVSMLGSRRRVG